MKAPFLVTYFLFLISFFTFPASAQSYDPAKVNKKAVAYYDQARDRAEEGSLVNATGRLLQAIDADKNYVDAYLALAAIYGNLKNYNNSIANYEKAFAIDSVYTLDYKISYAAKLAGTGEFEKALNAVNDFLLRRTPKNPTAVEKINKQKRSYEFALEYAKEQPDQQLCVRPQKPGEPCQLLLAGILAFLKY